MFLFFGSFDQFNYRPPVLPNHILNYYKYYICSQIYFWYIKKISGPKTYSILFGCILSLILIWFVNLPNRLLSWCVAATCQLTFTNVDNILCRLWCFHHRTWEEHVSFHLFIVQFSINYHTRWHIYICDHM